MQCSRSKSKLDHWSCVNSMQCTDKQMDMWLLRFSWAGLKRLRSEVNLPQLRCWEICLVSIMRCNIFSTKIFLRDFEAHLYLRKFAGEGWRHIQLTGLVLLTWDFSRSQQYTTWEDADIQHRSVRTPKGNDACNEQPPSKRSWPSTKVPPNQFDVVSTHYSTAILGATPTVKGHLAWLLHP